MRFPFVPSAVGTAVPALLIGLALASCQGDQPVTDLQILEIADVGFMGPAAVVVDTVDQVYLVSNLNGRPGERNANGFISRISPEGEVLDVRWTDHILAGTDLALHSPKGMAIRGDSLLVADMNCVRILHRGTGQPLARECVMTADYLSDVDVGPDGSVYVLDSGRRLGSNGEPQSTGTDAVYRLVLGEGGRSTTLARGEELGHPSAVAVGTRGIFVATARSGEIFRVVPGQARTPVYPATGRYLDGIVFLPDGGFAFSSWSDETVFRVTAEGRVERLLENVPTPGGLAYDAERNRLIVPLTEENRVIFVELP
jgi:sugar lactone lactonase YvrE